MRSQSLPTLTLTLTLISCLCGLSLSARAQADTGGTGAPAAPQGSPAPSQSLPRFGLAAGVSTLGATIQAATAVTRRSNLRFGFSDLSYNATSLMSEIGFPSNQTITYSTTLRLRSAEILYDQYFKGPFHISPGVMIYDGNKAGGNASVASGQYFTLGGVPYYSQAGNPIAGTWMIGSRKVAPMVLLGFGNLLPRSSRHFTVNFDLGVVFQGSPNAVLNLNGGACSGPGSGCVNAATNSTVQANIQSEQTSIGSGLSAFKYYPVVSLTFGYKF